LFYQVVLFCFCHNLSYLIETQKGGKYKGEVRLLYYDLLTKGVLANTVQYV
jgi:hypothetical protein